MPKVESAKKTLEALNPDVKVVPYQAKLTSENIMAALCALKTLCALDV